MIASLFSALFSAALVYALFVPSSALPEAPAGRMTLPPDFLWRAGLGLLGGLLSVLFLAPLYAPAVALLGVLLAPKLRQTLFRYLFKRKLDRLRDDLEIAVHMIAANLRSGQTLLNAILMSNVYVSQPLRGELIELIQRVRVGELSLEESLKRFSTRYPSPETALFAHTVLLASQMGGAMVPQVIESLAQTIRERKLFEKKVRAKTTSQRIGAIMATTAPFLILIVMAFFAPNLFQTILTEGRGYLYFGLFLVALAWVLTMRILNIEDI